MTDLQAIGLFGGLLLASVALGEAVRVALGWSPESSRRLVHVGVGLTTAASPAWFDHPTGIYALAVVFVVGNAVAAARGWIPGMHAIERQSWGTAVFPFALVVALWLCWTLDAGRVALLQTAFVVLALADPAASFVGSRWGGRSQYHVGPAFKSLAGSAAFAVVAAVATGGMLQVVGGVQWPLAVGGAVTVAVLATVAEALGRNGWDNLWIVLAVVVPLSHLQAHPEALSLHLTGLVAAGAFGVLTVRAGWLDVSGALAGSILAWLLVAVGGWAWAAPALTFFAGSSLMSRLGRDRKRPAEALADKGSQRDAGQVIANGGVGMALLAATVFSSSGLLFGAFVGAFAAAAADTWATEIGTAVRGRTRRLWVGAPVEPGASGGMSLAGTAGAIGGAASVALAAALAGGLGGVAALALVGVGLGASVVDSVLGATLQARYRHPDGRLTERASGADGALPRVAGWRGVTNDVVNAVGSAAGAAGGAWAVWALG